MRWRPPFSRFFVSAMLCSIAGMLVSCGGASTHKNSAMPPSSSASNVQPVVVNSGPANNYANGIFTSITVCMPSTSTCQTIDSVLVDTGSYGLRLLSSAGGGELSLSLPAESGSGGSPIGECASFVSGYTWGPVTTADVTIAGEQANKVPVQVIDQTFASVPPACKNGGLPANVTLQTLGANGILGVGPYAQDCGNACTLTGPENPGLYYSCSSDSCQVTAEALSEQVQNPVALFAHDNNGVLIQLPAVSAPQASLNGYMIFGIGTQSNNHIGKAEVFPIDSSGNFNTTFNGQTYPGFVDSGSNALFFLDSSVTGLTVCGDNSGFYCPASTTSLSATTFSSSAKTTINFSVDNADDLFSNHGNFVFGTLAGPNSGMFDWGLPFFFGRNVFTAIESRNTPSGPGPYWAY